MFRTLLIFLFWPFFSLAQQFKLMPDNTLSDASFRSISIVNDSVIWVGGSHGTVCMSADGGSHFKCKTVQGYDSAEFRSL